MLRVGVAVVPADMSLADAFDQFRPDTRGLVVDCPDGAYLVTASDIADAWNAAADAGEDPACVPIGRVDPPYRFTPAPPLALPPLFWTARPVLEIHEQQHFFNVFRNGGPQYTFQDFGNEGAAVVTSNEGVAEGLDFAVTVCTCKGTPVHKFEKRQLVDPRKCNKPHGVTVTCRTIGGK